ncbi:hypothetical protein EDD18DRAFT_1459473 [Armillaria luteobubalina]|uniref:Uncharacterized protein n=1 Tax=Armillaria luteobubalina TaxID=153913 RepID=A0AA39QD79_9AGAR|nr:hypothetical protein EDD18DRAFT_1459473 [Armillaria luteobubalina]
MSELVNMLPRLSFADSDDRRAKNQSNTSARPWGPFEGFQDEEQDLDELEARKLELPPPTEVFIECMHNCILSKLAITTLGPTVVQIITYPSILDLSRTLGRPRHTSTVYLSFSTYGPNNRETLLQASYTRPKDDVCIQGFLNGDVSSFKGRGDGSSNRSSSLIWAHQCTSLMSVMAIS